MTWLRKLFTEHLGLKLLSLALAVGLWAAVGSDPVTEATFRVPVEFINVPGNLEVLTEQPTVQLWARGPSHAVRQASATDFEVRVNAAQITEPGENTFSLDPSAVTAPTPLQVTELVPSEVRVTFERTVTKQVPVDPQFTGVPARGYNVTAFHVNPPRITLVGPCSHIKRVTMASTDPVDLTNLSINESFVANVYIADPLVRFVSPKTVTISVDVEPSQQHRSRR